MTVYQRAFVRGGVLATLIGLVVLGAPVLYGLLLPGPTDSRIYTNLVLLPVFSVVIFAFGGFIGLLRALSRAQKAASKASGETPVARS